jgi:BASS family bile acid:Na+ symporter
MLAALLSRHFWITAYAMLVAGMFLPGHWAWTKPAVPVFLGGILYFTCLKISLAEVRAGLRLRTLAQVAALAPLRLLVLPLLCWAVARVVAPAWAPGLLLLAASPAGMSTVAFADLYGGSRMFALLLVLGTSVLCPLTIPLLIDSLGQGGMAGGAALLLTRMGYLVVVLVSPFILAQLTRRLLPAFVERHRSRWTYGSIASSCLLVFIGVASNRTAWQDFPFSDFATPVALATMVCLLGFAIGMTSRLMLQRAESIAFTCGEIWLNNGLAVAFASQFFAGEARMILPAVLMQVPIVATMALYGRWTRFTAPAVTGPPTGS